MREASQHLQPGARRERRQSGGALVEFAVVTILLWMLLAGVLDLGRALAAQQILQNAAASAARDLSLRALPPGAAFADGRAAIFDEGFLVVDADLLQRCLGTDEELSLRTVAEVLQQGGAGPLNRLLVPLWIRDRIGGEEVLRYPGTVLQRAAAPAGCAGGSRYTVRIPELDEAGALEWRNVVEPLPMEGQTDPFPFQSGAWSALQVSYPFQAAGLQAWRGGEMVAADEVVAAPPEAGLDFVATDTSGPNAGRLGLGVLYSMGREVRPFRRVLSASAAFRREVFAPSGTL